MNLDRLKCVRIEGLRSVEDLVLTIDHLQVLIGENGAGKSSIIEAFEMLSLLASDQRFVVEFSARHGAIRDLLMRGAAEIRLSLRIESDLALTTDGSNWPLEYKVVLRPTANSPYPSIAEERLMSGDREVVFSRQGAKAQILTEETSIATAVGRRSKEVSAPSEASMLKFWGSDAPVEVERLRRMLEGFRIHVPFETRPTWSRPLNRDAAPSLRDLSQMEESDRLSRGGLNLTAIFQQLNAEGARRHQEILEDIQLGLGTDVLDFAIPLKGRFSELSLMFAGVGRVPSSQLSEGQLSFLGLVALRHFNDTKATLVLFDEPELHLNPALVVRAAGLFLELSKRVPVLLATHSEALFDSLDPVEHVRVLELAQRKTVLRTLSKEKLAKWRTLYSSVGDARRDGRLEVLLAEPHPS